MNRFYEKFWNLKILTFLEDPTDGMIVDFFSVLTSNHCYKKCRYQTTSKSYRQMAFF